MLTNIIDDDEEKEELPTYITKEQKELRIAVMNDNKLIAYNIIDFGNLRDMYTLDMFGRNAMQFIKKYGNQKLGQRLLTRIKKDLVHKVHR